MNKVIFFMTLLCACVLPARGDDDPFLFDEFAIVDSDDYDVSVGGGATLNSDAMPVNVSGFDIAGIMLGMNFDEVYLLSSRNGGLYAPRAKNAVLYTISQEWKYNLDYECRQQHVYAPAELEKCINSLAQNRGLMYVSQLHLERANTGEKITVYFTSNATDNVVWRVVYENDVNELEGNAEKFANQREKKILKFWQDVLDKYGAPNSGTDTWLSSNNSYDPLMRAYYGSLELIDNGLNASDATRNVQTSREYFRAKTYAF